MTDIKKLIKEKSAIRLDIGGGANPQPGFVNIDILPLPNVDIVWDLETFPWPLPDECVSISIASHVLEHINPAKGIFVNFMNEVWRVTKPGGQFAFVVPYAESFGMYQDPTHCNFINEATMNYFDPLHPSNFYGFYRPKPWKVTKQTFSRSGVLECLLEKRPMDKSYTGVRKPDDLTREDFSVGTIRSK